MVNAVANTRKCTGSCRRVLPETDEYFYRDSRSLTFAACCRDCHNAKRKRPNHDGMRGEIGETQRLVAKAFQRIDPNGGEEGEFRSRLAGMIKRFRGMAYDSKAKTVAWFTTEMLRPEGQR